MTVEELIEKLSKLPQENDIIFIAGYEGPMDIEQIINHDNESKIYLDYPRQP